MKAFTPVCTTEIIAFSKANPYFEQLNACLLGLSVDSNASHLAWIYDIYCKTGIRVPFPIIADRNGAIARKYGMISNDVSTTETVRNVFLIDEKGMVRLILVYPMNVGRCIPEILRALNALQVADSNKASTPANWVPCQPVILTPPQTFMALQEKQKEIEAFAHQEDIDAKILTDFISEYEFSGTMDAGNIRDRIEKPMPLLKKRSLVNRIVDFIRQHTEKYQ